MFAIIDDNNIVKNITEVTDEYALSSIVNLDDTVNECVIGYTYDSLKKAFIQPKPYPSYVLDEENFWWNPPVPYPNDGQDWYWNEESISWVQTN